MPLKCPLLPWKRALPAGLILAKLKRNQFVESAKTMWVVTYDNGSGYRVWASTPQKTSEEAWAKARPLRPGMSPGVETPLGQSQPPKVERVLV